MDLLQYRLGYDGKIKQIYGIWIVNLLLKIVTLGIYSFWGKARIRKYITGSISFLGDRFHYSGTGGELFKGFLRALPFIIVLYAPFVIWNSGTYPLVNIMFAPIIFAIYAGLYAAMRYRYSRLSWRGIRGRLKGSPWEYAIMRIMRTGLNILTFGIIIPYSDMKVQKFVFDNSYWGNQQFQFQPNPSSLMRTHIITGLLMIPTLGLSRMWYVAAKNRHICDSLTITNMRLHSTQTGGGLLALMLVNILIIVCTLGLGLPFVIQRNTQYLIETLSFIGTESNISALQITAKEMAAGEGIDGLLGDGDMGLM